MDKNANGWCDVHELVHRDEVTMTYVVETPSGKLGRNIKVIRVRLCNEVAMTLGLTQRDPVLA